MKYSNLSFLSAHRGLALAIAAIFACLALAATALPGLRAQDSTCCAQSDAVVHAVTLSASTVNVAPGGWHHFTAAVQGTNNPAQTVTWVVSGATSADTRIMGGHLTIGADETAQTLTVIATATADATKFAAAIVSVTNNEDGGDSGENAGDGDAGGGNAGDANDALGSTAPVVHSVTLSADAVNIAPGDWHHFTATVHGANNPALTVTWSVSGATSAATQIMGGHLTVGADETAPTLTVTATATADATKFATANVTVTATGAGNGGDHGTEHGTGNDDDNAAPQVTFGLATTGVRLTAPKALVVPKDVKLAPGTKATYEWHFHGATGMKIIATGKSYTVKPEERGGQGDGEYHVVLTYTTADGEQVEKHHNFGSVNLIVAPKIANNGTLHVEVHPAITVDDKVPAVVAGETFTLAVDLVPGTGTPINLTYEWLLNGKPAPDATNSPTYTAKMPDKNAKYSVRVSNGLGANGKPLAKVTSKVFAVKAIIPPTVTLATPKAVAEGKTAKLTAKATGTAKLTYEWYASADFDPVAKAPRPGATLLATTATLTLKKVTTAQAGEYTVRVTNPAGPTRAATASATLTVNARTAAATASAPLTVNARTAANS